MRIKRADLPAEKSEAVFRRMQTERQQRAASTAQGSRQSQQTGRRSSFEREVAVISVAVFSSSPSRFAARATASATESSPRLTVRIRIFSASTARCRRMRIALPMDARGPSSVRSRTSSAISLPPRRHRKPRRRSLPRPSPRPRRRKMTEMRDLGYCDRAGVRD